MPVTDMDVDRSQLGTSISLLSDTNESEEIPPTTGLDYMPTVGRLSSNEQSNGHINAPGTMRATDSAFESNNFTYSESGFNPTGSLRQTLQGSNLRNSSTANLQYNQSGSIGGMPRTTMTSA